MSLSGSTRSVVCWKLIQLLYSVSKQAAEVCTFVLYCLLTAGLIWADPQTLLSRTTSRVHQGLGTTHESIILESTHFYESSRVCAQIERWCPPTCRWPGPTALPWRSRSYCLCWRTWPRCSSHTEALKEPATPPWLTPAVHTDRSWWNTRQLRDYTRSGFQSLEY